MLSRAVRQKNGLFCPRQSIRSPLGSLRFRSHSNRPVPIINGLSDDQNGHLRSPSFQSNRSLATAIEPLVVDRESYMPFEDSPYSAKSECKASDPWASLLPGINTALDPSSLVIMDDYLQTKPRLPARGSVFGGDEGEMLANMDIALKVGQFDGASSIISRLGKYYSIGSPEYLAIHNKYMEAVLSNMISTRHHELVRPLQRWFEVDMPQANVKPDATTYAIMLKTALRMLHGTKRDRTVRRYWELAKSEGVEEEVLAVPILSELELGELSKICSPDLQCLGLDNLESETMDNIQHSAVGEYDSLPDVRGVEQKGLGLSSLKESLSMFSDGSSVTYSADTTHAADEQKQMHNMQRQRKLEADSITSATERWHIEFNARQKAGISNGSGDKRLGSMTTQWYTDLVSQIKEELKLVAEAESAPSRGRSVPDIERCRYGIYLRALDPEKLAAVTIINVMSIFGRNGISSGVKLVTLAMGIGQAIQDEVIANAALQKNTEADTRRQNFVKNVLAKRREKGGRMRWQALVQAMRQEDPTVFWPSTITARIGAVLMSLLFDVGKIAVTANEAGSDRQVITMQRAFQHSYQITWGRRTGLVHMHPSIGEIMAKEPPSDLLGRQLPMICKPKPWSDARDGGYYLYKTSLVRATPGETLQPIYLKAAMKNNGLRYIREALDILGMTGWRINRDVLDVMIEAWNSGEEIGSLAPLNPNLAVPPKPSAEEGDQAGREWRQRMREIENKKSGYHSVRCFQNFQLEVARAYRNEEFYLPHNMDFRGRAYPIPPYLNQMGADNARGLLLFSEAKPLGESGLRWLKVQIANLAGFDKASLSEREQFAMDHLDDIVDSADKRLHGRRWFLEAEDPWQCLAACIELRNALRSEDPTKFQSRLPIHQDGSCNGLQHYAALGGDADGAQQVNLEPSDRPSDVYTGVAEFVRETVARDAAQGDQIAQALEGRITRKIVKQTVMTNVYGVTFIGATRQVRKQLLDHYPDLNEGKAINTYAIYIAQKIFKALGTMFRGAHEIQFWLGDCATRITQSLPPEQIEEIANEALASSGKVVSSAPNAAGTRTKRAKDPAEQFKTTVIWTTPLGLPVVQPYWSRKTRRIETSLQDLSVSTATADNVVSRRRQLQAFPPNFIHSLDATHMMLSATACHKAGLTFSAVHDSFWTHACDVSSMNSILRDAFVRMHSDDIIQRLAEEFKVRYGDHLFLAKIERASPIGRAVRAKRRTKSSKVLELLEEYKRQKLLKSEDPELQAQGRAMRTAAAIFEEMGGTDDDLSIVTSLGQKGIGHVPANPMETEKKTVSDWDDDEPDLMEGLVPGEIQDETEDLSLEMPETSEALLEGQDGNEAAKAPMETEAMQRRKQMRSLLWLWLPVTFRKVPTKGKWDLTRIRNSQYFFS